MLHYVINVLAFYPLSNKQFLRVSGLSIKGTFFCIGFNGCLIINFVKRVSDVVFSFIFINLVACSH